MIILILYETVEGHTKKIARHISDQVEASGHQVVLADVREPGFAVPGRFDAAVLCGPIHLGKYPQAFFEFVRNYKDALNHIPGALVTVSLGAASEHEDERNEAQAHAYDLAEKTGWSPTVRHSAAGAIKYLEYNYFKRFAMRRMLAHAGGPVDTSKDYELTDWDALREFTAQFLGDLSQQKAGG